MMAGATWTRAARLARALAERYGRLRAAPRLADLVLRRIRPLVRVQAWHRHTRVLIAPRVTFAVAAAARAATAGTPPAGAPAAPPGARIVERLFTRTTRVESVQRAARPPLAGAPFERPAAPVPAAPPGAVPATRILARARPAEGPGRRPDEPRAESGGMPRPGEPSPATSDRPGAPSPAMPPLDVARLTDRVARELGQRVLAYRERLGRR
jgi:hypothetical protein